MSELIISAVKKVVRAVLQSDIVGTTITITDPITGEKTVYSDNGSVD